MSFVVPVHCAAVVCLCSDGIKLHIDEVEPVDGKITGYGFVQQLHAFIVENPRRSMGNADIGKTIDLLSRPHDVSRRAIVYRFQISEWLNRQ